MDGAVVILCALLLNALLAGPRFLYAPLGVDRVAHWPSRLIGAAERKLDREHRSLAERQWRGAVLLAVVFLTCLVAGAALGWIFSLGLEWVEVVLLAALLPVRPSFDRAWQLLSYLKKGDLIAARHALDNTPWRHSALLDGSGMARAGIELLAVQFTSKIFSPSLWFCVGGLPGFFFARAVYLMVETLNVQGQQGFGRMARMVHGVMDYVPSRLAGFLWMGSAYFLSSANPKRVARVLWHKGQYGMDSQSYTLLAAAEVLNVSLGGPMSAYGDKQWQGSGSPRALPADVAKAMYLFCLLHLFLFIGYGLLV